MGAILKAAPFGCGFFTPNFLLLFYQSGSFRFYLRPIEVFDF
jgi:hypothetical protein